MRRAGVSLVVFILLSATAAACGDGSTEGAAPAGPCSNAQELADFLRPEASYDYNPTQSPGELASRAGLVYRASDVTLVEQRGAVLSLSVDRVEVVVGPSDPPTTVTLDRAVAFDPVPSADTFVGAEFLVFGSPVEVEGLWVSCGGGAASAVIIEPDYGDWPSRPTLEQLIALVESS